MNCCSDDQRFPQLSLCLPDWVEAVLPPVDHRFETLEERMALVIALARRNVEEGSGGPFGAAIFERDSGKLVAPGVNLVVSSCWSGWHAEMVATAMAQQLLGTHDLGAEGLPAYELVASTEPCAMCFGATPWSGVRRLLCGARDADARAIGFDEGPKPMDWRGALAARGIEVVVDLLRDDARAVLHQYQRQGGPIYNGRAGD
ncbi:nucleoside deaminase [Motiliproteus sediminis]|uniref:nucleoside deaminase n=1 Tax=Motiliproteus sediminis TaxID=1468178 RepID=UPI001AEF9CCB|nr:nucleoside deaminase [Motiliproteus sediminis]